MLIVIPDAGREPNHLNFKTMKMIQPIRKKLLFLLLISAAFISCNNKTEASIDDTKKKVADDTNEKVTDADHTFDIRLVKGSETIEYSETIPSNEGGALYGDQKSPTGEQGARERTILMVVGEDYNNGEAGIFGNFRIDENWKPITAIKHAAKNASFLSIRPNADGDNYDAISGTLNFSNLKFVLYTLQNGAACFELDFDGDFQKNNSKEDIYSGSGTIVLSPKRDMGVYKEK